MTNSEERRSKNAEALERTKSRVAKALVLKDKGYSNVKIAEEMGVPESAVRTLLNAPVEFGGKGSDNDDISIFPHTS